MSAISSRSTGGGFPDFNTVTAASQQLAAMKASNLYRLSSDTDCYFAVGSNPTAAAADGSHFLGAGREAFILCTTDDDKVAVIRKAADGVCTLSIVQP